MVITTGWLPVACETAASRCPASVRVTPEPPVTAAIRSSQTAVELLATFVICAPSVPPTEDAAVVTSLAQSGLTYHFAPANGLSTCVPGVGVAVGVTVPVVGVGVGVVPGVGVGVLEVVVGVGVIEVPPQTLPLT